MGVPIFLITDFGDESYYVGALKGAIKKECPEADVYDITHRVLPFNVKHGSFLIWQALTAMPKGAIVVGVVDPGVGSNRDPIVLTGEFTFVGPDNGLFWPSIEGKPYRAYKIDLESTGLALRRTGTFDGRDVFAPIAGKISCGRDVKELGSPKPLRELIKLNIWNYRKSDDKIIGEIMNVDRFGNLVTNIPWKEVQSLEKISMRVGKVSLRAYKSPYYEGRGFLIIRGSTNLMEISIAKGNAAKLLGVGVGDVVEVIT